MKKFILISCLVLTMSVSAQDFLSNQLTYPRVQDANMHKYDKVSAYFKAKNLSFPNTSIFWRAFKWNKALELWAYHPDSQFYIMVKSFPICEIVGELGPKRQEGDFQIPEGFYYFENFNPSSKYYLSLKVSYPNGSDMILGVQNKLGGDIYVHGGCETIGCLPMTDSLIQEIYLINMYAKGSGQDYIPIHIFPTKLTTKNFNKLKVEYFKDNFVLLNFWKNLKEGYDFFDKKRILPMISIDDKGKYIFQ